MLAGGLLASAIAAPTASSIESRSPDRVLAERGSQTAPEYRSPDRVLAESGRAPVAGPEAVTADTPDSGGFDWSIAGITAVGLGSLLLLSIAVRGELRRRRRVVRS